MKMLRITKGVTSDFSHTLPRTDLIDFFHTVTALKYETPIFQKFITCLSDNSYMYLCICFIFFKILNYFLL